MKSYYVYTVYESALYFNISAALWVCADYDQILFTSGHGLGQ